MASSFAFLNSPLLLLEKVTCRLVVSSILLITVFPRTITATRSAQHQRRLNADQPEIDRFACPWTHFRHQYHDRPDTTEQGIR
uniref:Uncharacterized protein n=1 Tax=Oryza brachyantha TaxID=4533 RepID=J3MDX5_ORYBR